MMNKKGFTLIELLIVVVIIGILAAIAIPKFANTKEKAYITAMKSDLRNLVTAEEAYFADWSTYTSALATTSYRNSTGVVLGSITPTTGGFAASVSVLLGQSSAPVRAGGMTQAAPTSRSSPCAEPPWRLPGGGDRRLSAPRGRRGRLRRSTAGVGPTPRPRGRDRGSGGRGGAPAQLAGVRGMLVD